MGYVITILTSVASAMLVFLLQSQIKENRALKEKQEASLVEHEKALENGVVCLLRVKLIEYHAKYTELNYITAHAYENWILMYKAYKALGGNGMVEHMKEEVQELHFKRKEG